ncbi:cytochrome P450 [Solihabitans fulvus]|uniref:Cytochrome P450 n=2 Tax=Solihabitans fulvus TaxID=1892852 RepID=A0A5B2XN62_9PSEU|nr:cytochrome P450 [Solihabitans fulvus]
MQRSRPLDPPTELAEIRSERPVSRVTLWDGTQPWLVTRLEDARVVLGDRRFSADLRTPGFPMVLRAQQALRRPDDVVPFIRMDPPEHGVFRRMLTRDFMIKRVNALRPKIQEIVDGFLDEMLAKPAPADLVAEFALPVPSLVIALLLGVPYEDHGFFQSRSNVLLNLESTAEDVQGARAALDAYLGDLVDRRLREPGDDLISRLAVERLATGELSREQLVSMSFLLLIAGHETTANMTALSILSLLQNPDQLAVLRDDPTLIPGAVEELLRFHTIVHIGLPRVALEDVTFGDVTISAGEGVIVSLPAANRDEEQFADPDQLDVTREARRQIAFGFGVHQCLGQPLARAELQIAVETVLRRVPTLRLAVPTEEIPFRTAMAIYGVHQLPVTW